MAINAGLDRRKLPPWKSMEESSALGFCYVRSLQAHDEVSWSRKENEDQQHLNGLGKFLEVCSGCRKNIVGKDAFMYGCLQAFCSPQCRDDRITLDETSLQDNQNHRQLRQLSPSETLYSQFNCLNTRIRIHAVSKLNDLRFKSQS